MLQAIRSKASSIVVKILFGVLVISFGIWGIGDIFRERGVDTTVATVGDRKIDARTLNDAVKEQARAMFRGAPLEPEQIKQLGIVDLALDRLINGDLIDLEARHLGLALNDETVSRTVRDLPLFRDEKGSFSHERLKAWLANQAKSEPRFLAEMRTDMIRSALNQALIAGIAPPTTLVDALYRLRAERRVAEVVAVPEASDAGTPGDAEIAAYYEAHKDAFRTAELHDITVATLSPEEVAASIKIPEQKLQDEYQQRIADFTTPEQRKLEQILVGDEGKAKEAAAQLAAGRDFAEVAKDMAGLSPDKLDLGFFKKDELPANLADPVFALKAGDTTPPIEDPQGWHIIRVTEIKPGGIEPFDAVKDKLATEVARDMAGDQIAKIANQIEDALAGGDTFAQVAQRFGLKLTKVDGVDEKGRTADGKEAVLPKPSDAILRAAFAVKEGETSQLTDIPDGGYFIVQVNKITPAAAKPLDAVRDRVVEQWQQEKRDSATEARAKSIAEAVTNGQSLEQAAAAQNLTPFTTAPMTRSGLTGADAAKVPPTLVARLFAAKPGAPVYARGNEGFLVAIVKEILPPDPANESELRQRFAQQLTPSLQDDMLREFDRALRDRYTVSINPTAVAQAF